MYIYTVRDDAAEYFLPPFFAKTDAQAKRMFIGSLGDSFPHRKDFGLYIVGSFDDDNGTIEAKIPAMVLAGFSIPIEFDPANRGDPVMDPPQKPEIRNEEKTQ